MSEDGVSTTNRSLLKRLAMLAGVFLVVGLAAVVGPNWVSSYLVPVVLIVGVVYGAIIVGMWVIAGWPDRFGHGMINMFGDRKKDEHRPRS